MLQSVLEEVWSLPALFDLGQTYHRGDPEAVREDGAHIALKSLRKLI